MANDKMQTKLCERISELENENEKLYKIIKNYENDSIKAVCKVNDLKAQINKMKSITEGLIKNQSLNIVDPYNAGFYNGFVTVFNSIFKENLTLCEWNENKSKWELAE